MSGESKRSESSERHSNDCLGPGSQRFDRDRDVRGIRAGVERAAPTTIGMTMAGKINGHE